MGVGELGREEEAVQTEQEMKGKEPVKGARKEGTHCLWNGERRKRMGLWKARQADGLKSARPLNYVLGYKISKKNCHLLY